MLGYEIISSRKNVLLFSSLDPASRMNAKNVVNPPLKTAGPIFFNVFLILSSLDP